MTNAITVFEGQLVKYKDNLKSLLGQYGQSPEHFIATVSNVLKRTPKLLDCDRGSLFGAILKSAELGLSPSDHAGECYILPYGKVAQFQLGYKGFVELFYRSNVSALWSCVVRENDEFNMIQGTSPQIEHKPASSNRGEAVGAYAVAKVKGETMFQYMNKEEIMKIKDLSQAGKTKFSPWNSDKDPEKWMWQKTVIKQLSKTLPKSGVLSSAIHADNAVETGGRIIPNQDGSTEVIEGLLDISKEEEVEGKKEVVSKKPNPQLP